MNKRQTAKRAKRKQVSKQKKKQRNINKTQMKKINASKEKKLMEFLASLSKIKQEDILKSTDKEE